MARRRTRRKRQSSPSAIGGPRPGSRRLRRDTHERLGAPEAATSPWPAPWTRSRRQNGTMCCPLPGVAAGASSSRKHLSISWPGARLAWSGRSPSVQQDSLFDLPDPLPPGLPPGLVYEAGFLAPDEEAELIALIRTLPLAPALYKGHVARRRVASFGGSFDYDANRLQPAAPLVPGLQPLRDRVAHWAGLEPAD